MKNNKYSKRKKGISKSFLVFFLVGVILLIFIGENIFEEMVKQKKVNREVEALKEEIRKFEKDNKKLKQLADYFKSEDFKERELKDKLDLVKEGEKVVVVKKASTKNVVHEQESPSKAEVSLDRPNYYYWWKYFFGI
jgi:cell division protein FtsB